MIPDLTPDGVLPQGVHPASWAEVVDKFGWNARRRSLLLGLSDALAALGLAGCARLWLDGSFVTSKELPEDYDACWSHIGVNPALLDPVLADFSDAGRVARKSRYLGDLFLAGIERNSMLAFVDFFQQTRDGQAKGIVLLNPQENR